jgi:hypothetical protein
VGAKGVGDLLSLTCAPLWRAKSLAIEENATIFSAIQVKKKLFTACILDARG